MVDEDGVAPSKVNRRQLQGRYRRMAFQVAPEWVVPTGGSGIMDAKKASGIMGQANLALGDLDAAFGTAGEGVARARVA